MIDIHHHLLYGLDDGPAEPEAMRRMLQAAAQEGVRTLVATPHIAPGIAPFHTDVFHKRLSEAQALCDALALDLRVLPGAEMLYTHQAARYLAEGRVPTLGGTDRLLMEFSDTVRFETIEEAVQTALRNGVVPVLAHIERYRSLILPARRADAFKEEHDIRYQINCDVILAGDKRRVGRSIRRLLRHGRIDFVASDAHDCDTRRCRMKEAHERLVEMVGREQADGLTGEGITAEEFLGS